MIKGCLFLITPPDFSKWDINNNDINEIIDNNLNITEEDIISTFKESELNSLSPIQSFVNSEQNSKSNNNKNHNNVNNNDKIDNNDNKDNNDKTDKIDISNNGDSDNILEKKFQDNSENEINILDDLDDYYENFYN